MELGRIGLWTHFLDTVGTAEGRDVVAELDALGYGTIWIPEMFGRDPFVQATLALDASPRIALATGIASVYARDALAMACAHRALTEAFPGRFLLGLGISHQVAVEALRNHTYGPPLATMRGYLDAMDAAPYGSVAPSVPPERVLAALGPKMLELAGSRAAGAHPYFVPVEHTEIARAVLGDDPVLAPEQKAVLETDPDTARTIARAAMAVYLTLPNYVNNLFRLGYTEDDVAGGGSDRLVDAIVVWGDETAIAARVQAHLDAGADHVAVQLLPPLGEAAPLAGWRRLAPVLLG